ncbi:methyltransferase domain-containing protein [Asticcacaulis machinosus]|uniref:Methyltransferase domain-containing protein n=1 Tax=Asticcacaulis machinosus TaxID=2984211 RepID=A0ABT5HH93_9CAUL|nr:methyltransferase domain-containing protein [Asticcacaulis machinosus]MDC7675617.1 methyltransferase domain-containing protein [Asticcacaulis machinosus]
MSRLYHDLYERALTDLWPHLPTEIDGGRIADLGCHDGVMSDILAATFPKSKVYGFGQSRQGMDRARSLSRDVSWVEMPPAGWADELRQIAPGGFDLLISHGGAPAGDDLTDIAQRFRPHIKKGGRLIVQVPVTLNGWMAILSGMADTQADDLKTFSELTEIFPETEFDLKFWSSRYLQVFDDLTDLAEFLMAQAARVNVALLAPTIEDTYARLSGDNNVSATADGHGCAALEHVFLVACRK